MSFSSRGKTPSISILAKGGSFLTGNFLKPLKLDVVFDSYSSGFNRLLTNFRYIGSFAILMENVKEPFCLKSQA